MTADREPRTEAGREYLAAVSADTWSPEGRIEWARRFVLAIEAEARADAAREAQPDSRVEALLAALKQIANGYYLPSARALDALAAFDAAAR